MINGITDNESICVICDTKINDDTETKWSVDADPYCNKCYKQEENK